MKKKLIGFLVCILLITTVFAVANNENNADQVSVKYSFGTPILEHVEIGGTIYDQVILHDASCSGNAGEPRLPMRGAYILIPQGEKVNDITVTQGEKMCLGSGFNVEPVGVPFSLSVSDSAPLPVPDETIYSSSDMFPGRLFTEVGTYGFRGYDILVLTLYPVQYVPATGDLYYYPELTVSVETIENGNINPLYRGLEKDKMEVIKRVDNPGMVSSYVQKPGSSIQSSLVDSSETYEYVIITNNDLAAAAAFQDFMDYKEFKGLHATIMTTEAIYADPSYRNLIPQFNDNQVAIRNFIKDAYMNWEADYVLLAGDSDTDNEADNIIPARLLYATSDGLPLTNYDKLEGYIPSDVYYGCLDGNFNADKDDKWGENASGNDVANDDEADLYAEVWIGRACVDSAEEISNFVMKTLAYEQTDDDYLRNVLMLGEHLGFGGVAEYGAYQMEEIEPLITEWYTIETWYERDDSWNAEQLMNYLNCDTVHLINHLGHGYTDYALKISTYEAEHLTNDNYFFIYSQTCLAGSFDNWVPGDYYYEHDSFAEMFTVEIPHGAFAVILNSRYGLGRYDSTDSPGQRYHAAFIDALFNKEIRELAKANQASKEINIWRVNENGMRWIHYQTNLLGDPQVAIKGSDTANNPPNKPLTPSGSTSGKPGIAYTYTTSTIDPDGDQIYYEFAWGDGTTSNWLGPYASDEPCEAFHTWSKRENYEIKVRARDTKFAFSEWSDPLSVSMPKSKPYTDRPFLQFLDQFMQRFPLLLKLLQLPVFEKLMNIN